MPNKRTSEPDIDPVALVTCMAAMRHGAESESDLSDENLAVVYDAYQRYLIDAWFWDAVFDERMGVGVRDGDITLGPLRDWPDSLKRWRADEIARIDGKGSAG